MSHAEKTRICRFRFRVIGVGFLFDMRRHEGEANDPAV